MLVSTDHHRDNQRSRPVGLQASLSLPTATARQLPNSHQTMSSSPKIKTILIGLSGPSSSGKTTLARLLRELFNLSTPSLKLTLTILHQDDSYKTDKDVPWVKVTSAEHGTRELQDWDCVDSLDLPLFEYTLRYLSEHGALPEDSVSKEDQNSVGESHVEAGEVEEWKGKIKSWVEGLSMGRRNSSTTTTRDGDEDTIQREIRIYIVDGFLLYPPPPSSTTHPSSPPHTQSALSHLHLLTSTLLSPKLFIPSTRQQTLTRRTARSGYVTLEGFWTDPPGYVEDVVWPNYTRCHAWMYQGGNVGGEVFDEGACKGEGVQVCPGEGGWEMPRVLGWAVEMIKEAVEARGCVSR